MEMDGRLKSIRWRHREIGHTAERTNPRCFFLPPTGIPQPRGEYKIDCPIRGQLERTGRQRDRRHGIAPAHHAGGGIQRRAGALSRGRRASARGGKRHAALRRGRRSAARGARERGKQADFPLRGRQTALFPGKKKRRIMLPLAGDPASIVYWIVVWSAPLPTSAAERGAANTSRITRLTSSYCTALSFSSSLRVCVQAMKYASPNGVA